MRHHDAERLGISPIAVVRALGLILELLGRFPQVLVEEEEARLELGLARMQIGIDQRALGDRCRNR